MRPVLSVVLLASLAVVLGACGGGDGSPTALTSTSAKVAPTTAALPSTRSSATAPTTASPSTSTATRLDVGTAPWALPAPTSRTVALIDAGTLVVLGGQDSAHVSVATVERIDPVAGTATPASPLDPAVHDAAGVQRGADSLVIAGGTPPARAAVQAATAGGPTRTLGSLPAARTDHVAALVDGTIFVLGGAGADERPVASVVSSRDGASWADAGSLAEAVRYPAVAVSEGAVYLFGGVVGASPDTTAVQRYDPARHTTEVVAHVPAPLSHASAVVLGGQVWILGGFVNDTPSTQILRFDPRTNEVSAAGTLPAALTDAAGVATSSSRGLLVGGEGPGRTTTAAVVALHAR
jgi:hypothetical protein